MTGIELARIRIPSRAERYTATEGPDTWWPTPEPPHRVNQIHFEPLLFAHAQSQSRIRIINSASVEDFVQNEAGVVANVHDINTGGTFRVSCRYLVGCDGARSTVRKKIGAKLTGTPIIHRGQSIYLRAPELLSLIPGDRAWYFQVQNPRRCGIVFAIDGRETWLVRHYLRDEEQEFDSVDRDRAIRTILGVGPDFRYEVLSQEDFVGRRLVADHFRDRHAFICGDAAHLWPPNGGYGMNAGIADAADLSWLMAAVLKGWASPAILDAYESERQPITEQVSRFAMDMAFKHIEQSRETPAEIEIQAPPATPCGRASARRPTISTSNQFVVVVLILDISTIVRRSSPTTATRHLPIRCMTSRRHRFPAAAHRIYGSTTVVRSTTHWDPTTRCCDLTRRCASSGLVEAAARRRVPLAVLDIEEPEARALYDRNLVLVRPDQHVAWRGDSEPVAPMELIDLVRGASVVPARTVA